MCGPWAQIASANPGTSNELSGVSVASPANVWAVGDDTTLGSASPHTLVEHWDGTKWAQVAAPAPGTSSKLTGVSMSDNPFAPGDATAGMAVGQFTPAGSSTPHTLIENFNFLTGWGQLASPSPGSGPSTLTAISGGWAAGTTTSGGQQHPLLLREGPESDQDPNAWHQVPLPPQDDDVTLSAVGAPGLGLWIAGTKAGSRPFAAPVPDFGPVQMAMVSTGAVLTEAGLTTGSPDVPQPRNGLDTVSTPVAVNSDGDTEIAWARASDNHLWTLNSDGSAVDWGDQVAADSNPAIAALPDHGFVFAFARLGDHLLKVSTPDVPGPQQAGTGFDLAAETSPAVAASPQGGYEIAFAASADNDLFTVGSDGVAHVTGVRVRADSSPAITALPGGGYEIAFVNADDNKVWEIGPDGKPVQAAATEPEVRDESTPAIAASRDGGVEITFTAAELPQSGDNDLWYIDPAGNGHDTGLSTLPVSPAIVALPGGGFEIAYSDLNGKLTTLIPGGQPQHSNVFAFSDQLSIAVPLPAPPRTVLVPDFLGQDIGSVRQTISEIGLKVGKITQDNRCIDVKGTVLEQDPAGEATVPQGTPVDLLVSSGVSDDNGDPCIFK